MIVQRLKHLGEYFVVRIFICLLQAVRLETCQRVAAAGGILFADVLKIRGQVVDDNLRHAFPSLSAADRRRMTRQMWAHLFLLVAEVAHLPRKMHRTNWRDYVQLNGARDIVGLLLDERPILMISAHFGNFELAGYVLGLLGFPAYTVARPLDNPYLHQFVNRFRRVTGQHILPKKGGYEQIVDALSRGATMAFLADQYAGSKGCWVEFFGRPASVHKAISLFSLNSDAPMLIGSARRTGKPLHYEMTLHGVADPRDLADEPDAVRRLTQWYTSELERAIRRAPEQYWWVHRRWKDNRPARRRRRAA